MHVHICPHTLHMHIPLQRLHALNSMNHSSPLTTSLPCRRRPPLQRHHERLAHTHRMSARGMRRHVGPGPVWDEILQTHCPSKVPIRSHNKRDFSECLPLPLFLAAPPDTCESANPHPAAPSTPFRGSPTRKSSGVAMRRERGGRGL